MIIYSDSLSSLELLSSASQYKMDIDTFHCLRIIDNLASRGIRTYLQYIPSNSGIIGNHKADGIAKNASTIDQPSGRPIPNRDIYHWKLPEVLLNKNNPTLSPSPNKHLSNIYHRILSGSNRLNFLVFPHQFPNSGGKVPSSPLCRSCNLKNETIDHCLFECNMLTSTQYTLQCKMLECFKHHRISVSAKSLTDHICTQSTELNVYSFIIQLLVLKYLLQEI